MSREYHIGIHPASRNTNTVLDNTPPARYQFGMKRREPNSKMKSDVKPNFIAAHRKAAGLADHELAVLANTTQATINRLENGKMKLTLDWLTRLAGALKKSVEELLHPPGPAPVNEQLQIASSPIASSEIPSVVSHPENAARVDEPFPQNTIRKWIYELGRAAGGREGKFILNGEPSDRVLCPPELEKSSSPYLVRVFGTSMVPRFRDRERLQVDPDEPYGKGDDVVVQLYTDDETIFECYVKQFVSMNAKELVLEQLNPPSGSDAIMRFPRSRVYKIHKVVGLQMATRHKI